jgi:hypothetical protein
MTAMTVNEVLVKNLAYRYKFKTESVSINDLNSLFYPYHRNNVDYYMVGRSCFQQFYLGVDRNDKLWKLEETDHYNEQTEQHSYSSKFSQVSIHDIGDIGHW